MHMMSLCSFSHCNGDSRWHNALDVTVSAIVMVTVGGIMYMMSLCSFSQRGSSCEWHPVLCCVLPVLLPGAAL